jgi:hypothetical protein
MRKVFALFAVLVLLSMLAACSDDSTTTPPKPAPSFQITTQTVPVAYSCSPYNTVLEVQGGTAPYSWTIAAGSDALPEGIVLTADGRIIGVMTGTGSYTFTVRVTDSSPTPKTYDKEYSMSVEAPTDPSMAVFFDGEATVCQSSTTAFMPLSCYVFIMLNPDDLNCAQACEFKLRITDKDDADLEAGTQYAITSRTTPSYVVATLGDLFSGMAFSFNRPMYGPEPVLVASFDLLLLEDLSNLSFKFEPNPNGSLGVASCDVGFPIVEISGREAAINY